ncbi:P-loop containing nucleoside triphosphate hydrolase protein [Apodospora peruviana]|uniref:P-loop containing nucleoside triphosphate hydrolase protein n=1 Tax=Apodospora peruviana TaxID=516989 RepID=A0AAE0IUZ0_9PEZI|nr:P-loop containing nucleoside triphosphate hydrolase protein [Apodospora peruviana]
MEEKTPRVIEDSDVLPVVLLRHSVNTHQFVGRQDKLSDIAEYFDREEFHRDELPIYSICGIGGVGKTELALQYAKLHAHKYQAMLWAGAESIESLRQDFTKISMALGLAGARIDRDPDHNLALVHQWFRCTDKSWLLVLDNVEKYKDVQPYIPFDCRGSVIITTRYTAQAQLCRRKLTVLAPLSDSEAADLFIGLLGRPDDDYRSPTDVSHPSQTVDALPAAERSAVHYLLQEMGGLVLGIHQIVALIRFQDLRDNIAKFAERYRRQPHRLLSRSEGIEGHTLATLWEVAFTSIREKKNAWVVLGILSFLQPDEIPTAILSPGDNSILTGELLFSVDVLKAIGLVERKKDKLSLHRLVQTAFLFSLTPDEQQRLFDYASTLVEHAFPKMKNGGQMYGDWKACSDNYQHVRSLALLYSRLKAAKCPLVASEAFSSLMMSCAWHLFERGTQREALEIVDIAIDACLDKQGLVYAHLLNSAMMSYFKLNDMANARRVLDESRAIREKLLHCDDQELASTYGNLGTLALGEGKLDEGYGYLQRTLDIRLRHPEMGAMQGVAYVSMGRILFLKGEYDAAAEKYELCERLFLENGGPDGFLMVG